MDKERKTAKQKTNKILRGLLKMMEDEKVDMGEMHMILNALTFMAGGIVTSFDEEDQPELIVALTQMIMSGYNAKCEEDGITPAITSEVVKFNDDDTDEQTH